MAYYEDRAPRGDEVGVGTVRVYVDNEGKAHYPGDEGYVAEPQQETAQAESQGEAGEEPQAAPQQNPPDEVASLSGGGVPSDEQAHVEQGPHAPERAPAPEQP